MARYSNHQILPNDPAKLKAWSAKVAEDAAKEQYFSRMTGPEGSNAVVVRKTEVGSGKGDEVTSILVNKMTGPAKREGEKLAGAEQKLSHSTHTMRINEHRNGINVGSDMSQIRVGFSLKQQARQKLTDYIKTLQEETQLCAATGARGVGALETLELGYTGYPNALRAPDTAHLFVGKAGNKVKATLADTDLLALSTINKLRTKAKKMTGGEGKPVKIETTTKGGKSCYILMTCPEGLQDIRDDVGSQGWFEAQKALVTAIGKDAELFKGGAGMFNGILVDENETGIYFDDYGASSNIKATRSLLLGANALCVANGTKGMKDGMTVTLREDEDDRGHDLVLTFEMIFGADKSAFDDLDYGLISVDTAYTPAV